MCRFVKHIKYKHLTNEYDIDFYTMIKFKF